MHCSQEFELFDLSNNATIEFLQEIFHVSALYGNFHKYIALLLCMFGSIANTIHIFVLTRPIMRKSNVNQLLSFIATCDICTMISYMIYIIRFRFLIDLENPPQGYALIWVVFIISHVVISISMHTIALYLWVATAYLRYKSIKKLEYNVQRRNISVWIFGVIVFVVMIFCIPTLLVHDVTKVETETGDMLYNIDVSEASKGRACNIFKLNLWLTGIAFKVIPCVLLIIFTAALFIELRANQQRRKLFISKNSLTLHRVSAKTDRTTLMLVILLGVFLCTELPQGALSILNGLYPNDIHQFIYTSFGEILDLLSLINCNACFVIYPIMSSVYRKTMKSLIQSSQKEVKIIVENTRFRINSYYSLSKNDDVYL